MEEEDFGTSEKKVILSGYNVTEMSENVKDKGCLLLDEVVNNEKMVDFVSSEDEATYSSVKKIKLTDDNSSLDTVETIKKIQAFIALGKTDEPKKDSDLFEKPALEKSSSKKVLESRENQNESGDSEKINNISELQRTLQGLDDSQDNADQSEIISKSGASFKSGRNDSNPSPFKENSVETKSDRTHKLNDHLTPSRVSKRIQSKSVKFSAKKMLRGDDASVLKRMIPGYERDKKLKKDKIAAKIGKGDSKKPLITSSNLSESKSSSDSEQSKESIPLTVDIVIDKPTTSPSISSLSPKSSHSNTQSASPSSPISTNTNALDQTEKTSLADQLGKFAVTNGKITLELKSSQEKKVVRIAVPPQTTPSPMPKKTSFGPDIIIKRVKPVKKPPKDAPKTNTDKETEQKYLVQNVPQIIKMSPRVNIEKIPVKKLKEDIVKIQKDIIKSGKSEDIKSNLMSVKFVNLQKPIEESISNSKHLGFKESDPETPREKIVEAENSQVDKIETSNEEPSLTQQITAALENTYINFKNGISSVSDDSKKQPEKSLRGRKPLKLLSSSGNQSGKKLGRTKKSDVDRSPSVSDVEELPTEEEPEEFATLFDRYFSTNERYIEHHDSLDSDSSADFDNEIFSHFVNLRNKTADKKREEATVYDLMHDISIELPTWNIHASSNGEIFYLVQVDSTNDKPFMKKVVELDLENNAKVYVDNKLVPGYEGNYRSYEDIRQLIYDIDQM